jgi:hypothetical protein
VRQISNGGGSAAPGEPAEFATLLAVAAGVPRSFPFHNIVIHFHTPAFGEALPISGPTGPTIPGVTVGDAWWVNGRTRSLSALTAVDADPGGKRLPAFPEAVAAILAACGRSVKIVQVPLPGISPTGASPRAAAAVNPEIARAVGDVVRSYRSRFAEILEHAALPHDLPAPLELLKTGLAETSGPKKPALARAFEPLGYDCRGGSGTFTLRRRTPGNLTVEIGLDVGTWSNLLLATFRVYGLGLKAILPMPVSKHALGGGQYPIGGPERWGKIVDNLAALVREFDHSFVPAIEEAAGPSPDWYKPES